MTLRLHIDLLWPFNWKSFSLSQKIMFPLSEPRGMLGFSYKFLTPWGVFHAFTSPSFPFHTHRAFLFFFSPSPWLTLEWICHHLFLAVTCCSANSHPCFLALVHQGQVINGCRRFPQASIELASDYLSGLVNLQPFPMPIFQGWKMSHSPDLGRHRGGVKFINSHHESAFPQYIECLENSNEFCN